MCSSKSYTLIGSVVKFLMFKPISKRGFLYSFLLGFLVRLTPELLSYPNLIGFDTVGYAARIRDGVIWPHWSNIFTQSWFLYALLIPPTKLFNLDPLITLKIASPIMYGMNSLGVYNYSYKTLRWKVEKSLLASLLFSFSIASLRISWDLYRNTLGLAVLLFTLSLIPEAIRGKKLPWFIFLSTLTVLSHELTAATLLIVIAWITMKESSKSHQSGNLRYNLFYSSLPALLTFLIGIYLRNHPIHYEIETNIISAHDILAIGIYLRNHPIHYEIETNIIDTCNILPPNPLGLFFLTNYLHFSMPVYQYATYTELASHVLFLFPFLYVIWLPFTIKGFFKNQVLDVWTILLLVGSFSALVTPFSAILLWDRWMFMLVYPFTFYTANGIEKSHVKMHLKWLKYGTRGIIIATVLIGILFTGLPSNFTPFYTPLTYSYIPSSMQQNTIPLQDVEDAVKCLEWLNRNMNRNSVVLVHHAFLSWAKLYLGKNHAIVYCAMNLTKALDVAQQNGFKKIYLVWWKESVGWYPNIKVSENFKLNYGDGSIVIYRYE